jgi:protocatechuate 4,5-dioxygenase beta chain
VLVYNDHASAFSLAVIPTFAIGCAESYAIADEGFGPRPVPVVQGHAEFACHITESLILDEFDMTVINQMGVDHGLDRSALADVRPTEAWPVRVVPIAVNVVEYPQPTGERCFELGQGAAQGDSLRRRPQRPSLGHGRNEPPASGSGAGLINSLRHEFFDQHGADPDTSRRCRTSSTLREAGSEGIEMIMWLIMRGALGKKVKELYRFYHVPASNTAVGHLILKPTK